MLKKIRLALLISLTLLVSGCATTPKETTANIPLINSSLSYSLKSNEAVLSPLVDVSSDSVFIEGNRYEISSRYTSLTGKNCVRFSINQSMLEAACENNGQWKRLNALVKEAHN